METTSQIPTTTATAAAPAALTESLADRIAHAAARHERARGHLEAVRLKAGKMLAQAVEDEARSRQRLESVRREALAAARAGGAA